MKITKVEGWRDSEGKVHATRVEAAKAEARRALPKMGFQKEAADLIVDKSEAIYELLAEIVGPCSDEARVIKVPPEGIDADVDPARYGLEGEGK